MPVPSKSPRAFTPPLSVGLVNFQTASSFPSPDPNRPAISSQPMVWCVAGRTTTWGWRGGRERERVGNRAQRWLIAPLLEAYWASRGTAALSICRPCQAIMSSRCVWVKAQIWWPGSLITRAKRVPRWRRRGNKAALSPRRPMIAIIPRSRLVRKKMAPCGFRGGGLWYYITYRITKAPPRPPLPTALRLLESGRCLGCRVLAVSGDTGG